MAARRLIPLLDRVLIDKVQAVSKTAGGVLLPESVTQKVEAALPNSPRGGSGPQSAVGDPSSIACKASAPTRHNHGLFGSAGE